MTDKTDSSVYSAESIRIALLKMINHFNSLLDSLERPNFIDYYSAPDSELRDNFREAIESLDRVSGRLLEGAEKPEREINPEEIDLGNSSNPEEPIRDPIVRYTGFLALRSYIRAILELIMEGEFLEKLDSPDSAAYLKRLRNTILSLNLLAVRLLEGLEINHE